MDDIIDADAVEGQDGEQLVDADAVEGRDGENLERYRAITYLDGDETVTIIQERENDDAWIQSDLTFEVRT